MFLNQYPPVRFDLGWPCVSSLIGNKRLASKVSISWRNCRAVSSGIESVSTKFKLGRSPTCPIGAFLLATLDVVLAAKSVSWVLALRSTNRELSHLGTFLGCPGNCA